MNKNIRSLIQKLPKDKQGQFFDADKTQKSKQLASTISSLTEKVDKNSTTRDVALVEAINKDRKLAAQGFEIITDKLQTTNIRLAETTEQTHTLIQEEVKKIDRGIEEAMSLLAKDRQHIMEKINNSIDTSDKKILDLEDKFQIQLDSQAEQQQQDTNSLLAKLSPIKQTFTDVFASITEIKSTIVNVLNLLPLFAKKEDIPEQIELEAGENISITKKGNLYRISGKLKEGIIAVGSGIGALRQELLNGLLDTKYEPILPATPVDPTTKYLNGNRQWAAVNSGAIDTVSDTTTINLDITAKDLTANVIEAGLSLNNLGEKSYNSLTDLPTIVNEQYWQAHVSTEAQLATALAAGYTRIIVTANITLTSDKTLPDNLHLRGINQDIILALATYKLVATAGHSYIVENIVLSNTDGNVTISDVAYDARFINVWFDHNGTSNDNWYFRNATCRFINCQWTGNRDTFVGIYPNATSNGIWLTNCRIIGEGSNATMILCASAATVYKLHVDGLIISGTWKVNASNVILSGGLFTNITVDGPGTIRLSNNGGVTCHISNFFFNGNTVIENSTGYHLSSGRIVGTFTISADMTQNRFDSVFVTGALTVNASSNDFVNCRLNSTVTIAAGVSDVNITGSWIASVVTDSGTGNSFVDNHYGDLGFTVYEKKFVRMKNTSGTTIATGAIVTLKAVAGMNEITTTTTADDGNVFGVADASIANNAYGFIQVYGKTTKLLVNGTTDIAIGDYIITYTEAGIGQKAVSMGQKYIARAFEAYTTDNSSGVIDAWIEKGIYNDSKLWIKSSVADALKIGNGTAGIDYQVTFDGETNDGIITYKEDEDELNFDMRTTYPGTFGGIHVHDNSTAQSIPTGVTYTKLTCYTDNDGASNVTPDAANDKITITKTGYYMVNCSLNFSCGTNNVEWAMALFLNNAEVDSVHIIRKISTAGDIGSASFSGIIDVTTANWDVDVRARHDNAGSIDLTVVYSNLSISYLGET